MRKLSLVLFIVLIVCLIFVGCTDAKTETDITVSVLSKDAIIIKANELETTDFTAYFIIFEKAQRIEVLDSFLDKSELPQDGGKGTVVLKYKGSTATLNVNVVKDVIVIGKTQDSIILDTKQIKSFDFTSLFTLTVNGESVEVEENYINKKELPILPGKGIVSLTYEGQTVSIDVELVQAEKEIIITANEEELSLSDEELSSYNFKKVFSITEDGKYVTVMASYITVSEVSDGFVTVSCEYKGKSESVKVAVQQTVYELTLESDSIEVNQSIALTYDYLSLFQATRNGEPYKLTTEMVQSNVTEEIGDYEFTVTVGTTEANTVSKTLNVNVVFAHQFLVVNCFNGVTIAENELDIYDYTQLFALYVDGKALRVTEDMIDTSALLQAVAGDVCDVLFSYTLEEDSVEAKASVMVVERADIIIIGQNISVDLRSVALDLRELFTIKIGEESIPVTHDMISGEVNYLIAGAYTLTCTYGDVLGKATVTVTDGVVISAKNGNKVCILKGTNQNTYSFANDFNVTINGIRFTNLDSCIDYSQVDFNTVGEYNATLTIKYNTKKLSLGGVKFDEYTFTITYDVIDTVYTISKPNEVLVLPKGTNSFDVLSKLDVRINNRKQALTTDPDKVSVISCYVRVLSNDIDFDSPAHQEVSIGVYVYGVDKDPVIVKYYVCIESDIVINTVDKIVFEGDTVYTTELFDVTENGKPVDIDYTMLNGKVNTFISGIYTVSIQYKGVYAETNVVVCSNSLKGEYFTPLKTIPKDAEIDDDEQIVIDAISAKPIGDMILSENGITVNGVSATDIHFIGANEITFKLGSNMYTLYYFNGVAVLDPDNSIKLGFSDYRRPYIYFNKNVWEYDSTLIVNTSSKHILQSTVMGYSIDLFGVKNKVNGEKKVFGLKVHLVNKTSADTYYQLSWGEATYPVEFERLAGEIGKVVFLGDEYTFTMQTDTEAKINEKDDYNRLLANKTFSGAYEGDVASLSIDNSGCYLFSVNGEARYSFSTYDFMQEIKNGGYDPTDNTVLLYKYLEYKSNVPCFSIKVSLDLEQNTFTVIEKTPLWGVFVFEDKYIFLDGYGKGYINYNTSSSYVYELAYTINSGILSIRYLNTNVTFPYGDSASFFIESFNNILRIQEFYDESLIGATFENKFVSDGAIVRIHSSVVGKNKTGEDAKTELIKNIEIITKDGELSKSEIESCCDFSLVRFSTPGFYKFGIKISVGGETIQADYVVQVLDSVFESSSLVGTYSNSIITAGYSLSLDKWGRAILVTATITYESNYKAIGNDYYARFTGVGYDFSISGSLIEEGLISIVSTGSLLLNDYLTTGFIEISASDKIALRKITVGDNLYFFLSSSVSLFGDSAEVSVISGSLNTNNSILKVLCGEKEYIVTINSWNDKTNGIVLADALYGTYTNSDSTMLLNGFGVVRLNGLQGTYSINSNKTITVTIGDAVTFYDIDLTNKAFSISSMKVDNSIMENKVLSASYLFGYEENMCSASTTFSFLADGKVLITSNSPDYYEISEKAYAPIFVSVDGENTTYIVVKNKLTITINKITFVFFIKDVSKPNEIVLLETSMSSSEAGYFAVGQTFAN